jgi:hypothetical protein
MLEYDLYPYPAEWEAILEPHIPVLQALLDAAGDFSDYQNIPAANFVTQNQKNSSAPSFLQNGGVPHRGDLTPKQCAQAANWFSKHITSARKNEINWVAKAPLAHVYTLLFEYMLQLADLDRMVDTETDADMANYQQSLVKKYEANICRDHEAANGSTEDVHIPPASSLELAWLHQTTKIRKDSVDVDLECLSYFEERLFEYSKETGDAGNQQWGLNAGPHQDDWSPYVNLPEQWNHDDRVVTPGKEQAELEVCNFF